MHSHVCPKTDVNKTQGSSEKSAHTVSSEPRPLPSSVSCAMPPKKKVKTTRATNSKSSNNAQDGTADKSGKNTQVAVRTRRDRQLRGRRGGLEAMPDMPLDVLVEVRTSVTHYCIVPHV